MATSTLTDDAAFMSLAHADAKLADAHDSASIEKKSFTSDAVKTDAEDHGVSEEDQLHLRRVADAIPWRTYLIAYIELAERFSFYVRVLTSSTPWYQVPVPSVRASGTWIFSATEPHHAAVRFYLFCCVCAFLENALLTSIFVNSYHWINRGVRSFSPTLSNKICP